MSYYIFCDLIDEHTETFENENTFPEHLGAHRSDGSKAVNVWKLKPGDKFLFMKSGFSVIADGQVTDVKYLEDEDIFKVDYGINSWENEACLNDEEWRVDCTPGSGPVVKKRSCKNSMGCMYENSEKIHKGIQNISSP